MKKVKIICIILAIFLILFFCLFGIKNKKSGNNIINQDNVKDIFNLKEYKSEIEVTVTSNKNENKYKIKQEYFKDENKSIQEILEPEELKGIKIIKQSNKITLENTELTLNKIFDNYNGIAQNDMDLESFVKDFTDNNEKSNSQEKGEEIILETQSKNENKYTKYKTLTINKKTGIPTKMEIKDINKKTTVYIVYNIVEIK